MRSTHDSRAEPLPIGILGVVMPLPAQSSRPRPGRRWSRAGIRLLAAWLVCAQLLACGLISSNPIDLDQAAAASSLAFIVNTDGRTDRVQYQIDPEAVPAPAKAAMDRLHPGSPYTAAKFETDGQQKLYRLWRTVNHLEVSAAFRADGTLLSEEMEIPVEKTPSPVLETITERFPNATDPRYSEVRDVNRTIRSYHVRLRLDERQYKLQLYPNGVLINTRILVNAQVEVPVELF